MKVPAMLAVTKLRWNVRLEKSLFGTSLHLCLQGECPCPILKSIGGKRNENEGEKADEYQRKEDRKERRMKSGRMPNY